jgi:hypothetical protein
MTKRINVRERFPVQEGVCLWLLWDIDCDMWDTTCGNEFQFTTDGPRENKFRFCPYCGGRLRVRHARPAL